MNVKKHAHSTRTGTPANRSRKPAISAEDSADLWRRAHTVMDGVTPLGTDCGLLCGARCCSGGPLDGMLLFPGEEMRYQDTTLPANWVLRESGIRLPASGAFIWLLVCTGTCDRARRPLACRVFPLLPRVDARGGLRVAPDLRALSTCPLLHDKEAPRIRPAFVRAVEEAFSEVVRVQGVVELLRLLQEENREISRFFRQAGVRPPEQGV